MKPSRLCSLLLAAVLAVALPLSPSKAEAAVDVYVTPGNHVVNGRQWSTTCEPYSQTKRCTTKIWATQVSYERGRFVQKNGWVFNNLTYAASPRTMWKDNPIAAGGYIGGATTWTTSDGRNWRTECDTAVTGNGGCRSYIQADVIETYTTGSGSRGYRWTKNWLLNNMVRFTPGPGVSLPTAPPMKQAPAFLKGRRHFSLGNLITYNSMGGQSKGTGRLANIELDPGGKLGTFKESYWSYSFDMAVESQYSRFRTASPVRPTGCKSSANEAADRRLLGLPQLPAGVCDVRTADSFVGSPTVRYGTYEALTGKGGHRIKLYWNNSAVTETYLDATGPSVSYSELRLQAHSNPGAVNSMGFMFGSTRAPGAGRSLSSEIARPEWKAPRSVDPAKVNQSSFTYPAGGADKTLWTQSVGKSTLLASRQSFRFSDYQATSAGCIVTPESVRGRVGNGWHSYFCPLPSDGKMVWANMAATLVAEAHGLCPAYVPGSSFTEHRKRCDAASPKAASYSLPARPGGHVYEALQVIDDSNRLVGMVGLETSLYSHKASSQSQLGLFAAVAENA